MMFRRAKKKETDEDPQQVPWPNPSEQQAGIRNAKGTNARAEPGLGRSSASLAWEDQEAGAVPTAGPVEEICPDTQVHSGTEPGAVVIPGIDGDIEETSVSGPPSETDAPFPTSEERASESNANSTLPIAARLSREDNERIIQEQVHRALRAERENAFVAARVMPSSNSESQQDGSDNNFCSWRRGLVAAGVLVIVIIVAVVLAVKLPSDDPPPTAPPTPGTMETAEFSNLSMELVGVDPSDPNSVNTWTTITEEWYTDWFETHPELGISDVVSTLEYKNQDPPLTTRRLFGTRNLQLSKYGDFLAVSAVANDDNGNESGKVRVFEWSGAWVQYGDDINGEAERDFFGTHVPLSASGQQIAIGAIYNDDGGDRSGHVRVYEFRSGESWYQLGGDIAGESAEDEFGNAVALSEDGDILAIGGRYDDDGGVNAGHVRVYQRVGDTFQRLGDDIDGKNNNDWFGWSVDLSADGMTLAAGATNNDDNGTESGHVRVYKWDGSAWKQLGEDIQGEDAGEKSGASVKLSADGNIVAIGGPLNNNKTGHVRVFGWNGSSWVKIGADINGKVAGDEFGNRVGLSADGTLLAIGARLSDTGGTNSGSAYVYQLQ